MSRPAACLCDGSDVSEPLPIFPYHPSPLETGSVEPSDVTCECCGLPRGYIYAGSVYAVEELVDLICPWCIADGSAAAKFDASFNTCDDVPEGVAADVLSQICTRTPGYSSWQQERWLFHCGDGAAFLGAVGRKELEPYPDALDALRHEHDGLGWTEELVLEYLADLDVEGQPTAYLFRCRHCGIHLAYSDCT